MLTRLCRLDGFNGFNFLCRFRQKTAIVSVTSFSNGLHSTFLIFRYSSVLITTCSSISFAGSGCCNNVDYYDFDIEVIDTEIADANIKTQSVVLFCHLCFSFIKINLKIIYPSKSPIKYCRSKIRSFFIMLLF